MSHRALPVVTPQLRVASPCDADWDSMKGDDRRRHCGMCDKFVYNLPLLEPLELVELIERTEGNFCGRLFAREDGTVLTEDCPIGLQAKLARARRRNVGAAAAVGALMIAAGATIFGMGWGGCAIDGPDMPVPGGISVIETEPPPPPVEPEEYPMVMGRIAPEPEVKKPEPPTKPRPKMGKIKLR